MFIAANTHSDMPAPAENAASPSPQSSPLSPQHLHQLSDAKRRAKKVRRAASVAALSGWSMLVFACISLALAFFSDWSAWAVGIGLLLVALNELRGSAMLRRADPAGAKVLGWNQLVLAALLVAYATWSLATSLRQPPGAGMQSGDPQIDAMAANITSAVTYGLYGTMAILGLLLPGLTSIYYFSRARIVRSFLAETPAWIVEIMRRS
jgi:hypothetical protein